MSKTDVDVMTGTKVPALRFKGFNDEWVEKTFGELVNIRRGLTYKPTEVVDSESGIRVLRSSNICGDTYKEYVDDVFVDVDAVNVDFAKNGDILVTTANGSPGLVGKHAIIEGVFEPVVHGGFMALIESDKPYFINSWMSSDGYRVITNMVQGGNGSIGNLSPTNMVRAKLHIPSGEEQQQIGEVFKNADSLITTEQQKLEQLQSLKKSFLQKMFPKKGETVPELRFDGFSGDWMEKKLGDVFKRVSVKGRTDLPFITVTETETNVREDSHQGYGNDVSDTAKAKAKVILDGQFLIDLTSYSRGIYLCRMDGLTSNAYNVLDMSVGNEKFWSEYFITHNFVQSLKSITPPGARQGKMIEVDSLLKFDTMVPEQDEQLAIGQFFKTFDELIAKQEEKVENGKLLKKALLQKMFV